MNKTTLYEDKNTCTICGGIIRIAYTIAFEQGRPYDISVTEVPPGSVRLCPGHFPEQDKRHDGKLSAATESRVEYHHVYAGQSAFVEGVRLSARDADGVHTEVQLLPDEALSLLTWLLQERRQLEEIAAQVEENNDTN